MSYTSYSLKHKLQLQQMAFFNVFVFLLFFRENKAWHFMWAICLADDSYEMLSLIFSEY